MSRSATDTHTHTPVLKFTSFLLCQHHLSHFFISPPFSLISNTHTHTHTYTYIYTYSFHLFIFFFVFLPFTVSSSSSSSSLSFLFFFFFHLRTPYSERYLLRAVW